MFSFPFLLFPMLSHTQRRLTMNTKSCGLSLQFPIFYCYVSTTSSWGLLWTTANNDFKSFGVECFFLGSDEEKHWFISDSVRMPSTLDAKKITSSRKTHTGGEWVSARRGKENFSKWKRRERESEEKNVVSRTMGLIYFKGEFVSGMTIPSRLSDGWKQETREIGSKNKDKETFWRIDSIFLSIFPLSVDFLMERVSLFVDNGKDDVGNWVWGRQEGRSLECINPKLHPLCTSSMWHLASLIRRSQKPHALDE